MVHQIGAPGCWRSNGRRTRPTPRGARRRSGWRPRGQLFQRGNRRAKLEMSGVQKGNIKTVMTVSVGTFQSDMFSVFVLDTVLAHGSWPKKKGAGIHEICEDLTASDLIRCFFEICHVRFECWQDLCMISGIDGWASPVFSTWTIGWSDSATLYLRNLAKLFQDQKKKKQEEKGNKEHKGQVTETLDTTRHFWIDLAPSFYRPMANDHSFTFDRRPEGWPYNGLQPQKFQGRHLRHIQII